MFLEIEPPFANRAFANGAVCGLSYTTQFAPDCSARLPAIVRGSRERPIRAPACDLNLGLIKADYCSHARCVAPTGGRDSAEIIGRVPPPQVQAGRQLRRGVQHQRQPQRLVPDQQRTSRSDGRLGGGRAYPSLVHTLPAFEDATAASMKRMPAKPSCTVG